jgi:indolepyruvate ferredoxin oxidoreductase beta subunit
VRETNVLVAGVGGQGAILASELIALAAIEAGLDAKQGEFHGVAQRGGSVFSHVRFGKRVFSPMAPRGTVDFLLAMEQLEALRYGHFVRKGGTVVLNAHRIEPVRTVDHRPYPDDVAAFLESKGFEVVELAGTQMAVELGNHRAANVVLLGRLASYLDIPQQAWERVLRNRIPKRFLDLNLRAFAAGKESVAGSAV